MKRKKKVLIILSAITILILTNIIWFSEIPENLGFGKNNKNVKLHVVRYFILFGYADSKGNIKIRPKFFRADDFSDELAIATGTSGYGYINKSGKMILKPNYHYLSDFHEGVAVVSNGEHEVEPFVSGAINKSGKEIIPLKFKGICSFSEGLAVFLNDDNKFGYIDKTGKVIISANFEWADDFKNGTADVILDGVKKKIDKQGNVIEN